ncbi:hypothetical protein [Nonomuraea sp. NPDC048916]|uniref:hypothetical protein n=1 Tax=Nonomuraea sp. NPDC048916 TaxID=3154232 RepID=UPI0033FE3D17
MADYLSPGPAKRRSRRGYPFAVTVAAALLVFCAILPWAGVEASSDLIGGAVSHDVRGTDDGFGVYTLIAGMAALAFGLAGLMTRPWIAALAALPGALATLMLVLYVTDPAGVGERISVDLGRVLSVEPVIRYGWFAALASSLALIVFALLSLVPALASRADQS